MRLVKMSEIKQAKKNLIHYFVSLIYPGSKFQELTWQTFEEHTVQNQRLA